MAFTAYVIVLVILAFCLGYLIGQDRGETELLFTQIPATSEVPMESPEATAPMPVPSADNPLDLNTATQEELEMLPGIGPALAGQIVAYREAHGKFMYKEQILDVEGIGEKRYEAVVDLITVGGAQ